MGRQKGKITMIRASTEKKAWKLFRLVQQNPGFPMRHYARQLNGISLSRAYKIINLAIGMSILQMRPGSRNRKHLFCVHDMSLYFAV